LMIMEWLCPLCVVIPQTLRAFRSSLALNFSIEFWYHPVSTRMKDNSQYFFLGRFSL
jgi:predicted DsbA family dithiol-disulfide isomerase